MRLMLVNNAHPELPHVSGMRLGYFARSLARRGHQVVLLTSSPPNGRALQMTERKLTRHDWSTPFLAEVARSPMWSVEAVRHNKLPSLFRRSITAWSFLAHGGVFPDWTRPSKTSATRLLREFKPELVWATFGNTSNLSLAQWIARRAGCPWVVDVKDNWTAFVPAGLRRHMAWRFRDAAGVTANARHHLDIAQSWLRVNRARVVYSGVADTFFEARKASLPPGDKREILMIGSTYYEDRLLTFMATLRNWLAGLPSEERSGIRFVYAGSDVERVRAAISRTGLECEAELCGQLPIGELARRAGASFANSYLWAPFTFHHKLLELLVAGRPVLAFPGEHAESRELAAQCTTPFFACDSPAELKSALQQAWANRGGREVNGELAPPWRWDELAEGLEAFFIELATGRETSCAA